MAAAILLYHRVAQPPTDPWGLSVSRENFVAQLDVLRREYDVVPLVSVLDVPRGERPAVAITFDDGYVDNLTEAAPALAERGFPATIFLVSTPLRDGSELWWDWLDRLVLRTPSLPDELLVETETGPLHWSVPHLHEDDGERSFWRAWEAPHHGRQRVYVELYDLLFARTPSERQRLLDELADWAGTVMDEGDLARMLTTAEAVTLAGIPGVEIGAHTESHPCLARLSPALQEQEIAGSRRALERMLDSPVSAFSYPFGRRSDYTDETTRLVKRTGFDLACSGLPALVIEDAERFQLPRLMVHDRDGPDFEQWLRDVFVDGM